MAASTGEKTDPRVLRAELLGDLLNSVGSTTNALTNTLGNTVNAATNTVGNTVNAVTSGLGNTVNGATSGLGNTLDAATSTVGNTVNAVTSGLGNTVNAVTSGLGNTVNAATSGLGNTVNAVTSGLGNTVDALVKPLQPILAPILAPIAPIVAPIVAPIAPIVAPIIAPVAPIVAPIIAPVAPIVAPIIAPVAPIVAPIIAPVAPIVAPIIAPVAPIVAPILTPPMPTPAPVLTPPSWTLPPWSLPTPAPLPPVAPPPKTTPVPPGKTTPVDTPASPAPVVTPPSPASPTATTDAPVATATPSGTTLAPVSPASTTVKQKVPDLITHDLIDLSADKPYKLPEIQSNANSTDPEPAKFVSTKSDGTSGGTSNNNNSSALPGTPSSSSDKDRSGAASLRTVSEVGMSFGTAGVIVLVIALIMYVRKQRSKVQSEFKSDKFDPTELESQRMDFFETHGSHYMTGLMTSLAMTQLTASVNSAWDDEELLVVRIPLELVLRDELLSSGAFGEVYRGTFHDQEVAIKTLLPSRRKDLDEIRAFQTEIKLMAVLEHPRIVKFVGVAWESLAELCVVTEFMAGGDLTSLLASFETSGRARGFDLDKARIALHVAHALMYLHSLQPSVIHRDLKSKNVLLDADWNAKLTDFGVSRERSDETMTSGIGSSLWMAPEMTLGERYDEKADMFSFGVLLSELDTQQLPYANARCEETDEPIPQTTVLQLVSLGSMTVTVTESPRFKGLQRLVRDCVEIDPRDRPTAAEALHRIHVAWTSGLDESAHRISSSSYY